MLSVLSREVILSYLLKVVLIAVLRTDSGGARVVSQGATQGAVVGPGTEKAMFWTLGKEIHGIEMRTEVILWLCLNVELVEISVGWIQGIRGKV